jgi:adenosine deaminase
MLSDMNDLSAVIEPHLPLIDLHRHLDGNVRLETILDLGRQNKLQLPAWDIEGLRPYVQVIGPQPGVMAFISKFHWMLQILVDYDACRRVAYENVEDAMREGLDYIELRFSPWFMAEAHGLDPIGVVEAVCDGVESGQRDFGMRANIIGILSRTYGTQNCWKELQALLSQRERITALDLAGDEARFPASQFKEHFTIARQVGWSVTVHAGEIAGPESIWRSLRDLGAQRIGHAVAAMQDRRLVDYLCEKKIGIECNLTSNVQTSTVADYLSHPVGQFLRDGLLATINTDDPGISGINLEYEYVVAAPAAGLDHAAIQQLQRNALEVAFLPAEEKQAIRAHRAISGNARWYLKSS